MSTEVNTHNYRIPPLRGSDDYPSWKVYVSDTLTDGGLDDHIDPSYTIPTDATGVVAWNKADKRALSAIRLRVAPDIVHHITGCDTALEAWQTLSSAFETTGHLGIVLARHRLYTTRANDEHPLEDHVKAMRRIQGELKSLGKPIEDADFAVALLGSLPVSWDSFVRATLASLTAPTTKGVLQLITTEERRLLQRESQSEPISTNTDSTALVARPRTRPSTSKAPASLPHKPSYPRNNYNNGKSPERVVCNNCGGRGHYARDCPTETPDRALFGYEDEYFEEYDQELSDVEDEDFMF